MAGTYITLVLLYLCILGHGDALNPPNANLQQGISYVQGISQAINSLSQNPNSLNGTLANFLTREQFSQLSNAPNPQNLMQNAIQLLSNFTQMLTNIQNSNATNGEAFNTSDSNATDYIQAAQDAATSLAARISKLDVSRECLARSLEVAVGLGSQQQWALRMLDAAGKLPIELMNYNLNWMGSYDECLAIKAPTYDISFQGQYCTLSVPLPAAGSLAGFPGAALRIGICVPDACKGQEIWDVVYLLLSLTPIDEATIKGGSVACQPTDKEFDTKAIIMLCVCAFFIMLMSVATLYDITMIQWPKTKHTKTETKPTANRTRKPDIDMNKEKVDLNNVGGEKVANGEKYQLRDEIKVPVAEQSPSEVPIYKPGQLGKLLLSFSVYTNGKKILSTKKPAGTLTSLNGVRFLSMSWVIIGHTYGFGIMSAMNIATVYPAWMKRTSFQAIVNALVSVDSFFTLSGLLLTYMVMKEMERTKEKGGWPRFGIMFYFHRFWRLTPPYMLVLAVYVPLSAYFNDGPNYPSKGFDIDYCEGTWWTNLLYVNNFVKPEKMCMGWSWYLANDMQFYVVSPLMLIPLFFFPVAGVIVTFIVLLGITINTGVMAKIHEWPPTLVGGDQSSENDVFIAYYIKPYCRMGPYIVGMLTGYLLYKTKCQVKINRYVNLLGWAVATTLASLVLYGLDKPLNGHPLSVDVSALYIATHRTVWGACVCWVIFSCATGHGGYINTLLSWGAFIPLARLSYCAYLVHPIIMYAYTFSLRIPTYWTDLTVIYLFFGHMVASYLVAFVVSLAFEAPMMGMEKVLLGGGKTKK